MLDRITWVRQSSLRLAEAGLPSPSIREGPATRLAGLARSITPRIALPFHDGFVVGSASDGERFRKAAETVLVELIEPTNPFERK